MDLVKSFRTNPSRQLFAGALFVSVLCAVLFAAYFLVLRKPYEVLFTNLRTNDAATVVAELEKKKIPYRLADGGATIKAPADLIDKTRLDVLSSELPLKGAVGFELFNKSDMGLTEFAQKINYQRALQGELARTIMTMDLVESARIHLSIPEPTIFRGDRVPPKASVTIMTRGEVPLPPATVRGIQRLIAASVPDLALEDVVVLDSTGAVVSENLALESGAAAGPLSASGQEKQAIERYYAARIRQALDGAFPGKRTQVAVSADYDPIQLAPGASMSWAPFARTFPLRVTVYSGETVPQEELRAVTASAVGSRSGDTVTLSPLAAWQGDDALEGPVAAMPTGGRQTPSSPNELLSSKPLAPEPDKFPWPALFILAAVVVALAFMFVRRKTARRTLTAEERDNYATRLKQLLEEEGADVVSPT